MGWCTEGLPSNSAFTRGEGVQFSFIIPTIERIGAIERTLSSGARRPLWRSEGMSAKPTIASEPRERQGLGTEPGNSPDENRMREGNSNSLSVDS
jgi:hypothetical protein